MKKLLSLALTLVLVVGMSVPALAVTPSNLESLIVKSNLDYGYMRIVEDGFILTMTDKDGDENKETFGLLDGNGNEIKVPSGYEIVTDGVTVSEGMFIVRQAVSGSAETKVYKYGFMDTSGKLVVPLKYDRVCEFSEGLAAVYEIHTYQDNTIIPGMPVTMETCKIGFIDKTGKLVIPMIYEGINSSTMIEDDGSTGTSSHKSAGFSEGLISAQKGGKWAVIDRQGKTVFSYKYDSPIGSFHNGLASFSTGGKSGFIDKSGKVVIPATYGSVDDFSEGYAIVGKNDPSSRDGEGLYGAINTAGKLVVPMKYRAIENFHDGMARVSDQFDWGGKYGFVNTSGNLVAPIQYTTAASYSNGLALVALKDERFTEPTFQDRYGYIDKQGNVVIPLEYSYANSFSGGVAVAHLNMPDHIGSMGGANSSAQFNGTPEYVYLDTKGNRVLSHGKECYEISFSGKIGIMRQTDGRYSILKNPCYGV